MPKKTMIVKSHDVNLDSDSDVENTKELLSLFDTFIDIDFAKLHQSGGEIGFLSVSGFVLSISLRL